MISRFRSLAYLLPHLVRSLFTRPGTTRYPFAALELPDYFRGRVVMDADKCLGCGACVRDCPCEGLVLERTDREHFTLTYYPDRCAFCGQCELSCRTEAIRLTSAYVPPTTDRRELVEVLVDRC
jgi:formate hydrogenlyase subunit 6/NADH:ubiquinone oxidoreductase subunit I